jgi:L-2-hydroxyglutarate oxidase LhgO
MTQIDVAVVGGGVVGLASALALRTRGASVCVLEQHGRFGHGSSTRNSGVIHAGLYYPAGSLKATLCVEGRDRLYAFCEAHGVPFRRAGKLVLAVQPGEEAELERLVARAHANGVSSATLVDASFVAAREPHVRPVPALWSPDTGIVQAEELVRVLVDLCRDRDVALLPGSPVIGASPDGDRIEIATPHERFEAATVVNAAGLYADEMSALLAARRFRIHPCRGEYAELGPTKRAWVNGLVYPLPHASGAGLGVHLTRTTWGSVLVGPTIRYQDGRDDYEGDRLPLEAFVEPARALLPALTLGDLQPGGTGIRAKLQGPGAPFTDFLIERDGDNPSVIQAAGIDSPGLTACLAIGERVAEIWQRG